MAKRTKLTAPSAEELAAIDSEFRSENRLRPNPATAPIAQVAAEAAQIGTGEPAQQRIDRHDAERLREAQEKGLLITEVPTDRIEADAMIRDRSVIDQEELDELVVSIRESGQRLPIEVYEGEGGRYTLLSGYRRLMAVRALGQPGIKAIVRAKTDAAGAFSAMVEENEVRANLSHYERGRIAVIAAQQGAFATTADAVARLFASASPAKRSKVKSFAEVFEMLGDMLSHAEALSERRGLRLANALRQGAEADLRAALEAGQGDTADLEWAALEPVIKRTEAKPTKAKTRGRPTSAEALTWGADDTIAVTPDLSLKKVKTDQGHALELRGQGATAEVIDQVAALLLRQLSKK